MMGCVDCELHRRHVVELEAALTAEKLAASQDDSANRIMLFLVTVASRSQMADALLPLVAPGKLPAALAAVYDVAGRILADERR